LALGPLDLDSVSNYEAGLMFHLDGICHIIKKIATTAVMQIFIGQVDVDGPHRHLLDALNKDNGDNVIGEVQ
jgi:hypothetical protein